MTLALRKDKGGERLIAHASQGIGARGAEMPCTAVCSAIVVRVAVGTGLKAKYTWSLLKLFERFIYSCNTGLIYVETRIVSNNSRLYSVFHVTMAWYIISCIN